MSLLGRIRSLYLAIGLAVLTLISFGACGLTRLLFGHRVAKRVHELILGQGTYYWMRVTGAWHLTVKGRVPDTKETFVIVANHASTTPSSYSLSLWQYEAKLELHVQTLGWVNAVFFDGRRRLPIHVKCWHVHVSNPTKDGGFRE